LKLYGQIYFGQIVAYDEAIVLGDPQLADALWRNLFGMETSSGLPLMWMVRYMRGQLRALAETVGARHACGMITVFGQRSEQLLQGRAAAWGRAPVADLQPNVAAQHVAPVPSGAEK
jgi:hypothetical protein